MSIQQTEALQIKLKASLDTLIGKIGKIQIGTKEQFPIDLRKTAKERTI